MTAADVKAISEVAARALIETWERRSSNKFRDAERETDPMGKRLIEHGAMCYFDSAQELRKLIDDPS